MPVPLTLYHYTDAKGLLGIVQGQTLRATDVQFLNDGEELIYAARQISKHARNRADEICRQLSQDPNCDDYLAQRLRAIAKAVDDHADGQYGQVFVSCFCSEPDLLSQWRSYGRDGGFALGFDSGDLASSAEKADGRLERISYGHEEVHKLIQKIDDSLTAPPIGRPEANGWAYSDYINQYRAVTTTSSTHPSNCGQATATMAAWPIIQPITTSVCRPTIPNGRTPTETDAKSDLGTDTNRRRVGGRA